MPSSVITRKGQITIPKAVRKVVDWKEGDRVNFLVRDREVVLKQQRGTILDLAGSVKPSQRPEDFDAIRKQVQREQAVKANR